MHIAIARDEAFNFTYRANVDHLRTLGDVTYFSPLRDQALPPCQLLYLPGGYPELFSEVLEANAVMRQAVRRYAEDGGRVLAECGGMMYLCLAIDGREMCGVLPLKATMQGARLRLGYRQMDVGGTTLRGHEFHYSRVEDTPLPPGVEVLTLQRTATGEPVDTPLYKYKQVLAGYTHWYWAETTIAPLWNI